MEYKKSPKSVKEQAKILEARGLNLGDKAIVEHYLAHLNYYRLAGYWLPYEQDHDTHTFKPNTHFDDILNLYTFDRELRLILMDAIERVEISLRTQWAYHLTLHYGPHAYLDSQLSKNPHWHANNLKSLLEELTRTDEVFIEHYQKTYTKPATPPAWVICEVMSLGLLSRWIKSLKPSIVRAAIAKTYHLPDPVLTSFIEHLAYIRNLCAHHSRTWNRRMTKTMQLPHSKSKALIIIDSFNQESGASRKLYNTLVMLAYFLDIISPQHSWKERLKDLIIKHSIDVTLMGFPKDWRQRLIWRQNVTKNIFNQSLIENTVMV